MVRNGYEHDYAERIFKQVEGFGEYGFPESHAASFAFLVYISCWLKRHEPAAFLAAMLNSQPLGFYSSSQLIQDAKRHDVEVRPIDVTISAWDATLEEGDTPATPEPATSHVAVTPHRATGEPTRPPEQPAVRLGLNSVKSFNLEAAARVVAARTDRPFDSVEDLGRRAALTTIELDALAAADALTSLAGRRRQARWQAASHRLQHDLLRQAAIDEAFQPDLPIATEGRGDRRRLCGDRLHAPAPPAGAIAPETPEDGTTERPRTARPTERPVRENDRPRDGASATRHREGNDLRHAGG